MPTLSSHAPAHTTPSSKRDGADFEPDDEWKRKLKQGIEQSFKSMIQEAKDNQQVQLMEGNLSQEELNHEYKRTLHNIKGLAEEQYQLALMKERNERRWIAGVQMLPGWNDVLHEEQQNIMNSIKQSHHSDNSARAAESPTDERGTNGPPPSSSAPGVPHHEGSEPQSSDPPSTREAQTRDRPWSRTLSSPSSIDRRRHDNNTQRSSSRDREDQAPPRPSSLRRHNAEQHRPTLSEIFPDTPLTQEPEEQHPSSSRSSSGRPRSNSEKPWDSSLGKSSASIRSVSSADRHHFGRSPPKNANPAPPIQNPDLRRSSTASQDDPPLPPATKYQIGRRGSTASIRSTGSGHSGKSIRHPTTETIPERADDVEESPSTSTVKERVRKSTADKPPRDKESKRGSRRDSRPTPVDASIMNRYDHEPPPPSSLRSAPGPSSTTMQYATSASSSFVEDRFHHPAERDRPLKSSRPYLDTEPPYHSREAPQYASRDLPPSARPGPAPPPRPSPYVEERDFVGPFPPLGRPPASPFTGERENLRDGGRDRDRESLRERDRDRDREREYHPSISHKSSFSSYDERWRRERERERDWEQHWDEDREARERDNRDRDSREYWEREQRERERGGRDWDHPRERDRGERERDRDRELFESRQHREREREYAHPHSTPYSARTGGYPTPPSSASRVAQSHVGSVGDYLPMQEIYDDGAVPPSSAAARGSYGSYRGVVPSPTAVQDEWDYPPRPESGRPSIPTRQPSYGRREGERRGTIDSGGPPELVTDGYIRSYAHPSAPSPAGSIPIPRPPPSNGGIIDDVPTQAWQTWHAESARQRPPPSSSINANANDTWASLARSPTNPSVLAASSSGASGVLPALQPPAAPSLRPNSVAPVAEDHQRRTERRASVKKYHPQQQNHPNNHNRPTGRDVEYDDRYTPAAAHPHPHPTASTGVRHRVLLNEDQDDEDFSADSGRSNSTSEEESELDRYNGDREADDEEEDEEDEEDEDEDEDEADVKARELEAESQRLERERKAADAKIREQALELQRLKDEERRMEEEARKFDEEEKRKEDEIRRKEEEIRRKEEEAELAEARRAAERLAEDARKKEEETKRKEKEVKRREDEARRKADDARKLKLDAAKKAEETKKKEAEVKLKEEETKKKEEQLKEDEARNQALKRQAEQIAREAKRAKETIKKLEEETRKKELQIQEREAALLLREEELQRREAEARVKEEGSKREEYLRKEQEAREAAKRKEEEAKLREEEARRKEEEARRREEEATKRREDEARDAAKRKEDEARRERNRREQQQRQQQESGWFHEDEFIAGLDPKVIEEQTRLLQQAQFRKREEEIKRTRAEERKRHDSIGTENAWTPSFASASPTAASNANTYSSSSPNTYTSASPGTSPGMSRPPPQYSGSFNSDRNGAPTWGTSNSGWSSATKPTTVPSSSNSRTSSSIPSPFGKPRTGSVSSGSNPPGASPLGSEEWARRQQEFVNDQQEKFRREQEKIEAENQLRSAGKPLTRDEMTRLLEHHEKMWNRIAVPGTEQFTWSDIPWPMAKIPTGPDDISQPLIGAYMQSPCWPEKDKAKSTKDRIKDSLKRWHPDRFDNRCLMRVVDSDQERVKEGSGNVVRYLNELLRKENESATGIFAGD